MSLIINRNIAAGEVVQDAINDAEILKAPSQNAVFDALVAKAAAADVVDLVTLSGAAVNAEDLGTFTGTTISDNVVIKVALQELETSLETVSMGALTPGKENLTLDGTDITNQYKDLAVVIIASSLMLVFNGVVQIEGSDYSVDLTGGAGGFSRVTFLGDLATAGDSELVATDVLNFSYLS